MYNYHIDFFGQLNKFMAAAAFLTSAFIIVYVASKGVFIRMKARHLVLLKKRLESVAASKSLNVGGRCESLIGRIDPLEAAEVIHGNKLVLSSKLNEELKACFVTENKIDEIKRIALKSRNKWRRIQAIISLGALDDPAVLGVLESGLADKDENVAYFSMLALGQIKNLPSAKILLNFLDKHIYSGYKIVSLLEDFPPLIVEEVVKTTQSHDPFVRFWCLKLLAKFKPVQYLSQILNLTKDPSGDVRAAGCECLGEMGAFQAKDALIFCLKDEVWFVRMRAIRALAKILKSECIPLITPMLKDSDLLVRESAKNAIALNH